jgi:hypothetical protein
MKILSIDVGIKNLAFCLLEKDNEHADKISILKWDIINLAQKVEAKCCEIEKNTQCNKPAKFMKNSKCYCLKHSKKQQFQIPTSQLKPAYLNKQKMNVLCQIADDYKIKYPQPCKKADVLSLINDYIYNSCFETVENTSASKIDLVTIGRNMQYKFDEILDGHILTIDKVIIENQISPIANRMKTIQGMIAQYFIMRNNNIQIDFVNASNKLKTSIASDGTKAADAVKKMKYSDRKKLGIQQCLEFLSTYNFQEWEEFFKAHTKKDDLADSFLQAIWYINNKLTICCPL